MLKNFPHHYKTNDILIHTFIDGLKPNQKIQLDSAVGGEDLEKRYDELYKLLNWISHRNLNSHVNARSALKKVRGVLEVNKFMSISALIVALQNYLTKQFSNMNLGITQPTPAITNAVHHDHTLYEVCRSNDHAADTYASNPESVNYMGNSNNQG